MEAIVESRKLTLALAFLALGAAGGCKKLSDATAITPTTSDDDGSPTVPVGNASEDDGFSVTLCQVRDGSTCRTRRYLTHEAGDKNSPCKLDSSVPVGTNLQCVADVEELDFHFNGGYLAFNVPPSMCEYFLMQPYYFWNFEPGVGAATIALDKDKFGRYGIDANDDGTIDPVGFPGVEAYAEDLAAFRTASGLGAEYGGIDNGTPLCTYNWADTVEGAPQCCSGSYQLFKRAWDTTLLAYKSDPVDLIKWGGKLGNCIDGPGEDQERDAAENMPKYTITPVTGVGANDVYPIKSPMSAHGGALLNHYAANYFDVAQHGGSMPQAVNHVPAGTSANANPYYLFECLNRAHEVRASIWLSIREWDAVADFNSYLSTGLESGNWDRPLATEPIATDPFGTLKKVNDYWDWNDFELATRPFPQVIVR
jgi:hypothetical protein